MEKVIVSKSKLKAVADNIRKAVGTDAELTLEEMAGVDLGSGGKNNTLKALLDYTKTTYFMFYSSTLADLGDSFDYDATENVTDTSYMFNRAQKITKIPAFNTSKVYNMNYMFSGCIKLVDLPQIDTRSCLNMLGTFSSCYLLEKIDLTYYGITNSAYADSTFSNCYSLKALIIREFGEKYFIDTDTFNKCYHILGTINATYNPNGAKDGYVYVPSTMVDKLKKAINWRDIADQIRALEDYTVDGTTTGKLDENKVNRAYVDNGVLYTRGSIANETLTLDGQVIDDTLYL